MNSIITVRWTSEDEPGQVFEARFDDWIGARQMMTAIRLSDNLKRGRVTAPDDFWAAHPEYR